MAYLLLVRHGESVWNEKGLWTGLTDIGLSKEGIQEAKHAGRAILNIPLSVGFTSSLKRAQETLNEIKIVCQCPLLPIHASSALNERDYGVYTGKNKWEIEKEIGEEAFEKLRRGWDTPIPQGETLKDVYERVVPYYTKEILPHLKEGKNVIISAHGNSLRALIKYLDHIPDSQIAQVEIGTGEILVYTLDSNGNVTHQEKRITNPQRV